MSGGLLLTKVLWYPINDKDNPVDITDIVSMSISKSTEIKNNIFSLVLRNLPNKTDGTIIRGTYVDETYNLKFEEEDELVVYAKYTDDGDDIGSTWYTSDELIGYFVVEEFVMNTMEESARITLKSVDRAYILFNKVWTYNYGVGNTFTVPGVIRHISKYHTDVDPNETVTSFSGTNDESGVYYSLDARFTSEGGLIQDYRTTAEGGPSTVLDGALNDSDTTISVDDTTGFKTSGTLVITNGTTSEHISYTGISGNDFTGCTRAIDFTTAVSHSDDTDVYQGFPAIVLSKIWKPLFEWLGELVQVDYTNYDDEIGEGKTAFYDRAFLLWIDQNNKMKFLPADDDVDLELTLGDDEFRSFNLTRSVFDSINFVIYNCGSDMYGNGILWYYYDETSDLASLKMRYQPFTDMSDGFIRQDIEQYNSTRDTTNQDELRQFPDSGEYNISDWSFKTAGNNWRTQIEGEAARTELTSDSDYNDSLREACKWEGLQRAKKITRGLAGLRYKGTLALKGTNLRPGDLVQVTNRYTGLSNQLLRVLQVNHNINRNGWETSIDVEEDEKVLIQ